MNGFFAEIARWKSLSDDHFGHGDRHFSGHRPPPWSMQPLSRRDANSLFLSRNLGHAAATVSCFRCYRLLRTYVPYIHQKRCHDIDRKSLFHFFNSLHLENIAFFSLRFIKLLNRRFFIVTWKIRHFAWNKFSHENLTRAFDFKFLYF